MRQIVLPYTFDKLEDFVKRIGQMNISPNTYKVVHQVTLCGKSLNKIYTITSTAYASGQSSTVNLGLHSEFHEIYWDFVVATPAEAAWFNSKTITMYEQQMKVFQLLAGKLNPVQLALNEFDKCDGNNYKDSNEEDSDDDGNRMLAKREHA